MMDHCMWSLVLLAIFIGFGCGGTTSTHGSQAIVKWDSIRTMVVAIRKPEGTHWYLLEGTDTVQVAQALRDNTVVEASPSRATQTLGGTELRFLILDEHGDRLHQFLVDFQYVEGMGDKARPNPNSYLLQQGQSKRCASVLTLLEERGRPLSLSQFDQYARQFQDGDYVFLYWKN